ncbi:hypothetical protein [Shewanella woodyi]|uniref:hypothetical protein n=1 Tax=Shewanella woodyi TaxID=60961 RepID=UPI00059D0793|nr:hypothetical protein [Shewanella woodyi]
MQNLLKILIITSLLTGCASTVESEYIENNTAKVEAYTHKYKKELEDLAGFLVEECTMKKMSANKNIRINRATHNKLCVFHPPTKLWLLVAVGG